MPALVGVVLSYAVLVSGVPGSDGSASIDICAAGAGTCRQADRAQADGTQADGKIDPFEGYATPVEVDCSALPGSPVAGGAGNGDPLFHGCTQPEFDFRYRVSRSPDSERSTGTLGPQRGRRATGSRATWQGLPPDHGGLVSASTPPIAIYALTQLAPPPAFHTWTAPERQAKTRIVEPLDRPPRG